MTLQRDELPYTPPDTDRAAAITLEVEAEIRRAIRHWRNADHHTTLVGGASMRDELKGVLRKLEYFKQRHIGNADPDPTLLNDILSKYGSDGNNLRGSPLNMYWTE